MLVKKLRLLHSRATDLPIDSNWVQIPANRAQQRADWDTKRLSNYGIGGLDWRQYAKGTLNVCTGFQPCLPPIQHGADQHIILNIDFMSSP